MDFAKLIERVKGIILSPKTEWEKIAAENADVKSLYLEYAVILAAIPAIALAISMLRFSVTAAIGFAAAHYVLGLVVLFIVSLIINALAPTFDGTKNDVNALKLAVYSSTPAWLAGIFHVIPFLGGLIALIGAVYGVYVLYLGFSPLMKNPQEKSVGYTALTVVSYIAMMFVVSLVAGGIFMSGAIMHGRL